MEVWIQQFVSIDQLIEIGLNVIGYVAGGAFWLVIYSAWQNRRAGKTETVSEETVSIKKAPTTAAVVQPALATGRDIQYLDLRQVRGSRSKAVKVAGGDDDSVTRRRDHAEVFATARRMLEKGAEPDTIKSVLPISDGELALISGGK